MGLPVDWSVMVVERWSADTMPSDTEFSRPKGLPSDMTQSPTWRSEDDPISIGVRPVASALMTAMSEDGSLPTSLASYSVPLIVALRLSDPSTT